MPILKNFDIAGSALAANSVRLNTVASNLANAQSASGSKEAVYKARSPVFQAVYERYAKGMDVATVQVAGVVEIEADPIMEYQPNHPLADDKGYIYKPAISQVEEMANMIAASQSYAGNVEVMNTSKQLILQTLRMGQ